MQYSSKNKRKSSHPTGPLLRLIHNSPSQEASDRPINAILERFQITLQHLSVQLCPCRQQTDSPAFVSGQTTCSNMTRSCWSWTHTDGNRDTMGRHASMVAQKCWTNTMIWIYCMFTYFFKSHTLPWCFTRLAKSMMESEMNGNKNNGFVKFAYVCLFLMPL